MLFDISHNLHKYTDNSDFIYFSGHSSETREDLYMFYYTIKYVMLSLQLIISFLLHCHLETLKLTLTLLIRMDNGQIYCKVLTVIYKFYMLKC